MTAAELLLQQRQQAEKGDKHNNNDQKGFPVTQKPSMRPLRRYPGAFPEGERRRKSGGEGGGGEEEEKEQK